MKKKKKNNKKISFTIPKIPAFIGLWQKKKKKLQEFLMLCFFNYLE